MSPIYGHFHQSKEILAVHTFGVLTYNNYSFTFKKVQVGKDQEKAQSEKDSHSTNRGGKNQTNNQVLIP